MQKAKSSLLSTRDIQQDFLLGRDLIGKLTQLMPAVTAGAVGPGTKRLVFRSDLEAVLRRAARENIALWDLVRQENAKQKIEEWLEPELHKAA